MPETSLLSSTDDLQGSFGGDWRQRAKEVKEASEASSAPLRTTVKQVMKEVGKRVKGHDYRIQWENLALENPSGQKVLLDRLVLGGAEDVADTLRKKSTEDWKFSQCVAVGDKREFYLASGILIAPDVVLTSGHSCVNGYRNWVWVGNRVGSGSGKAYEVKDQGWAIHPQFIGPPYFRNDLAVLYLEERVPDPALRPIADQAQIDGADWVVAVGYGTTSASGMVGTGIRRFVHLPRLRGKITDKWDKEVLYDQRTEFVAGNPLLRPTDAKDSCAGDSGGPVFVKVGERDWRLAGITSRNAGLDTRPCGGGSIYVRLDVFKDWLETAVAKAGK